MGDNARLVEKVQHGWTRRWRDSLQAMRSHRRLTCCGSTLSRSRDTPSVLWEMLPPGQYRASSVTSDRNSRDEWLNLKRTNRRNRLLPAEETNRHIHTQIMFKIY